MKPAKPKRVNLAVTGSVAILTGIIQIGLGNKVDAAWLIFFGLLLLAMHPRRVRQFAEYDRQKAKEDAQRRALLIGSEETEG